MEEKQQNRQEEIEKRKRNFCKKKMENSTYYTSTDVTADNCSLLSDWSRDPNANADALANC